MAFTSSSSGLIIRLCRHRRSPRQHTPTRRAAGCDTLAAGPCADKYKIKKARPFVLVVRMPEITASESVKKGGAQPKWTLKELQKMTEVKMVEVNVVLKKYGKKELESREEPAESREITRGCLYNCMK